MDWHCFAVVMKSFSKMLEKRGSQGCPVKTVAETRHGGERRWVKARIDATFGAQTCGAPPCAKHRPYPKGNDIAADRISCKPQKLQAMSAIVKIGRGSRRQVGQPGRKAWVPCHGRIAEPSSIQLPRPTCTVAKIACNFRGLLEIRLPAISLPTMDRLCFRRRQGGRCLPGITASVPAARTNATL